MTINVNINDEIKPKPASDACWNKPYLKDLCQKLSLYEHPLKVRNIAINSRNEVTVQVHAPEIGSPLIPLGCIVVVN